MNETFLSDVSCPRCKGPISNRPVISTSFDENNWNFVQEIIWTCYACGKNIPDDELVQMESNS